MMAEKARLFADSVRESAIMRTANPSEQKALGRQVLGFDNHVWLAHAKAIVKRASVAKFEQNPDLKATLLATVGTTLVEASPEDRLWGIGLHKTDDRALNRQTWQGKNWFGEVLTKVRDEFLKT